MTTKEIVIIGGGIIGCTTAFYLSQHSSHTIASVSSNSESSGSTSKITLIEASIHGPAQGASGKAGGLVARWAYPKELSTLSFNEHVKLAEEHGGKEKWGWRYVNCGSWEGRGEASGADKDIDDNARGISLEKTLGLPGGQKPNPRKATTTKKRLPEDLNWIRELLTEAYSPMAPSGHTAQVHPYLFTTAMLDLAKQRGVKHIQGRATTIIQHNGNVTGVEYTSTVDGTTETTQIPATHVIVAAGAWSSIITPALPIDATRAHSLVIRPAADVVIAPYVLFTEITDGPTAGSSPEIYARPDGTVYACGTGDDEPLPESGVDDVVVDSAACDAIYAHVSSVSPELSAGTIEKRQACYLPSVNVGGSAGPIIGEARQIAKGLYIGTGHTCWGISNAPGTAKALTELIIDGKITSANLKKLDPTVFL